MLRTRLYADPANRFVHDIILDSCRNNPFSARMVRTGGARSIARGLANIEPEGNVLVSYSAKHGTTASDGSVVSRAQTHKIVSQRWAIGSNAVM